MLLNQLLSLCSKVVEINTGKPSHFQFLLNLTESTGELVFIDNKYKFTSMRKTAKFCCFSHTILNEKCIGADINITIC